MSAQQAVAQAAGALREAARGHKRASTQHRRAAARLMGELDRLRTACAELGITLESGDHQGGGHG